MTIPPKREHTPHLEWPCCNEHKRRRIVGRREINPNSRARRNLTPIFEKIAMQYEMSKREK